MTCDWAACTAPAHRHCGSHWHCAEHWQMHLAFEEEEAAPRPTGPRKERNTQRLNEVRTMVALGMSTPQISAELRLSEAYVRALRRDGGVPQAPKTAACGTRAGFARHKDRYEDPCEACCEVERDYQREHHARRRARRQGQAA